MFEPFKFQETKDASVPGSTSMIKRIAAIAFIFLCTTVAWGILGTTIFQRTYSSDTSSEVRVASTWGAPQNQLPPVASYDEVVPKKEVSTVNGVQKEIVTQARITNVLPLESSHLNVDLNLEHRQKGLLWYSTYKVGFDGSYSFRNTSDKDQTIAFTLNFPTAQAIYDDLVFTVDDVPIALKNESNSAGGTARVAAGKTATLKVGYKSQGLNDWHYSFGNSAATNPGVSSIAQVRDFSLQMTTNFKDIDFPENTLSPTEKTETANGWALNWNYKNLVSGYQIAMTMPEKLQPGPLAGRISFFAPVSLFFFFFLMLIITTMRGIELHPMNYFFLAAAFFSFHLLLAYLVDHVSIHLAFGICSAVSVFLVVTYLRLVVGTRFAVAKPLWLSSSTWWRFLTRSS
jgi:inner membrane protein involved in colicin E2 resistance